VIAHIQVLDRLVLSLVQQDQALSQRALISYYIGISLKSLGNLAG